MGAAQSTSSSAASSNCSNEKQRYVQVSAAADRLSKLKLSGEGGTANAALDMRQDIGEFQRTWEHDTTGKKVIGTLLSKQDLLANLCDSKAAVADTQVFNLRLSSEITPVTNQKSSGRCWLFSCTNVSRLAFAKRYNVDDFQFSQSYLFFWDKLEKSNYFLENVLELVEEPLDSRLMQYLYQDPQNDGGQWDMAVNLIEKYGLVPQTLYPESFHSSNSHRLDGLLTSKLREYSLELRALYSRTVTSLSEVSVNKSHTERVNIAISACRGRKKAQMQEIYTILCMTVGTPPSVDEKLRYEFYDKNKKFQSFDSTPLEIYKSLAPSFVMSDRMSLINDPRNETSKLYTVQRLGNVWGARPVLYVNTETDVLEDTIVKMLKADEPVWFGCDVGQRSSTALGVMDCDLYNYESTFGTGLNMSKAERLQTGESSMTHAMVIVAAHLDDNGKPLRYRIENSWSDTAGTKGYFVCTSEWFRQYAYQIVAPRKHVDKNLVKLFDAGVSAAVQLPPWDPMGSLA